LLIAVPKAQGNCAALPVDYFAMAKLDVADGEVDLTHRSGFPNQPN